MLNEDKINAILGEDFSLPAEDITLIKNTETWPTNVSEFYNQVKNTWDKWGFLNGVKNVWEFIAKNIIWAPVRAVGSQVATMIAGINSLASWQNETVELDTPFGKITSIDVGTDRFKKQATAAAFDTLSTIETFYGGSLSKWLKASISGMKNQVLKKIANLWLDIWYGATTWALQGAAGGYSEERNAGDAIVWWVVWGVTGGIFWWVVSLASWLRNIIKKSKSKKIDALINKSFDKTVKFYPKSELKWERVVGFKEDMKLRDALYTAYKQKTWKLIDSFNSWKDINKSILSESVENMDKLAQSASDAQFAVAPVKTTLYDIENLISLNKDLWAADVALKNSLLNKLTSNTLTPREWLELSRLLNRLYKKAWDWTKISINAIADDTYDAIASYWKREAAQDPNLQFVVDAVTNNRDAIRATTITQKTIENMQSKVTLLESAARQWDTDAIGTILDQIYNNGLGIKSKARIVTSILKNVVEKWNINESIDDIIKDAFEDINNNTAARIYQDIIWENLWKIKQSNKALSIVWDIEVQPKNTQYIPSDEMKDINKEFSAGLKKIGKDKIKTYPEPTPTIQTKVDIPQQQEVFTSKDLPKVIKEPVNYTEIYKWQTQWQLNSRKVSIQRKIAELSKNKTPNKTKIKEYNNEISQIDKLIEQINAEELLSK